MSMGQLTELAGEYRVIRGLLHAWLCLWFAVRSSARRTMEVAYRQGRLSEETEEHDLVRTLVMTRRRWTRWVDRNGRRYELRIQRCTRLEARLSGRPRRYLATVVIRDPAEQVGTGYVRSGRTNMLGHFTRRQEAWRAVEQFLEQAASP
jgi:hypothetical protein